MRRATAAIAASLLVFNSGHTAFTATAADPDQAKPTPSATPAKPMAMKEPMAGEMKKDGMMKEDVSKAEKKWSKEMDEKMKREKMK
jgi:hypothetical protein